MSASPRAFTSSLNFCQPSQPPLVAHRPSPSVVQQNTCLRNSLPMSIYASIVIPSPPARDLLLRFPRAEKQIPRPEASGLGMGEEFVLVCVHLPALSLPNGWLQPVDHTGQAAGAETVVDVNHRHVGGATVEHPQQRRQALQ